MDRVNIAFTLIDSKSWMGGFNYLLNLLTALSRFESQRVCSFIFCGDDALDSDVIAFEAIVGVSVIRTGVFNIKNRKRALLKGLLTGVDTEARDCFAKHRIDIVFESATFYGWRFPLPAIAWFPDLQHKLMPAFFSRLGWLRREIGFRFQIVSGRRILLSSETVREDCERLYPKTVSRTEVLRFPARILMSDLSNDPWKLLVSYNLPRTFAFLPNQFWKHKNHAVVIEALGILQKKGSSITVVATGNPNDPRHPELYKDLEKRIKELGVNSNFRILGMVPRSHMVALLQTCSVLINPSMFEGWSTTVEEGKALGVPMILSDLQVHREQMGDMAHYFPVNDARLLVECLENYMTFSLDKFRVIQENSEAVMADFSFHFSTIALRMHETKETKLLT